MTAITARRPWPVQGGPEPLRAIISVPAWPGPLRGAACAGEPVEMFFPEPGGDDAAAKAVCAACPVRSRCLEQAETRGERYGIWGGKNFGPRKPGRPPRTVARAAVPAAVASSPGTQAMDKAVRIGELRAGHQTIAATARAAGISRDTASFYLALLELHPDAQDRVRSGILSPAAAVAAVRSARPGPSVRTRTGSRRRTAVPARTARPGGQS